jgi:hypothetical protein
MSNPTICRVVLVCIVSSSTLGCRTIRAEEKPLVDKPVEFVAADSIQGTDLVLKPAATILIGEIHGTWETPILVASLVRKAVTEHAETILCIEVSSSEQASIDRFLNSDGGERATDSLLSHPHWSSQDGRASVGMFAMLELLRRLRSDGKKFQVVAMDLDLEAPKGDPASVSPDELKRLEKLAAGRDREMARFVIRAREASPQAIVIAYTGNVHTKVIKGAPWDAAYIPMGWYVSQKVANLVSLNAETAGGQAWVITDRGIGATAMTGQDRGKVPFVEKFENAESGYHGRLYVGRITAARPAVAKSGE